MSRAEDTPAGSPSGPPEREGTISWGELAREVAAQLAPLGIDGPDRNGRFMVMKACGAEPGEWFARAGEPATVRGVAAVEAMAQRRARGEPLQYVVGEWGFRHLDLYLDRRVLIPRPETEVVAGVALAEMHRLAPGARSILVADLGTGSGAIGLSLATEHPGARVWLTDTAAGALEVARANIAGLGRPGTRVRLAPGSWFEALPGELAGQFGVVVSNPPYVPDGAPLPAEVAAWEPTAALFAGPDGTDHLVHLIAGAGPWLSHEGSLVLELSPEQAPAMTALAAAHFASVAVEPDLTGRPRVLVAHHPRR